MTKLSVVNRRSVTGVNKGKISRKTGGRDFFDVYHSAVEESDKALKKNVVSNRLVSSASKRRIRSKRS